MIRPTYNPILVAEEVSGLLERDEPIPERLHRVVNYLRDSTGVDACSLYRHSEATGDLYLESTDGLAETSVGKVALGPGQGLTGLVVRSKKPLAVRDGPSHPQFHYVPGIQEEVLHSYLGVPIPHGRRVIGALVVQTTEPRDFGREDIALLNTISRQIAGVAADSFRQLDAKPKEGLAEELALPDGAKILEGKTLAPGCFQGELVAMDHGMWLERLFTPPSRGIEIETKAIRKANRSVRAELKKEAKAIKGEDAHSVIMAHKVMLEDDELAKEVLGGIEEGLSAAESVRQTAVRWVHILQDHPSPTASARATDFRDIASRLLRALGIESQLSTSGRKRIVAVASTVLPGDLLRHGPERIGAVIMTDQGIYSHTSILARSFGIPAVQLEASRLEELFKSREVLVDGTEGIIVLDPSKEVADLYIGRSEKLISLPPGGPEELSGPVKTLDKVRIKIGLNAGLLGEFQHIESHGPDDIGLYRTELPFMSLQRLPGYKGQLAHYKKVIGLSGGRRVSFRTFDFGGDKIPQSLRFEHEDNPMMGNRSTRYLLRGHTDLLRIQLRALLSASAEGPISILLPMISTPEEFNLVLDEINSIKNDLELDGAEFDRKIPIGVMIEVPSALFMIEEFSRSADFFSVGSNDLVQYLMASDRTNPRVSWLYQWHHPAILKALEHLVRQCKALSMPVRLCGEMANHPWAALLLVGMGYDHLSIDDHSIPLIKWTLMQSDARMLRRLAQLAMSATSSNEVIEVFYAALAEIERKAPPLASVLASSLDRLRGHAPW